MARLSVKELGDLGGQALVDFMETLPEEDVRILEMIPAGLVAKIFQAGCVFAMDIAVESLKES